MMIELLLTLLVLLAIALCVPAFMYLKEELEGADDWVAVIVLILAISAPIISVPILLISALANGYFTPAKPVEPVPVESELPENVIPIR